MMLRRFAGNFPQLPNRPVSFAVPPETAHRPGSPGGNPDHRASIPLQSRRTSNEPIQLKKTLQRHAYQQPLPYPPMKWQPAGSAQRLSPSRLLLMHLNTI